MMRTPYGISAADKGYSRHAVSRTRTCSRTDTFSCFRIFGDGTGPKAQFEMNRPLHDPKDAKGVDESTDTYDTIEWLVKNVAKNNGRVGIVGISYDGFLATMAMVNPHPALKAVSEQACMGDTWMGDDFFHNGAFRLSYGLNMRR